MDGIEEKLRGHIRALSQPRNPYHHPEAHEQARAYLRETLQAQGRIVIEQTFSTVDYGEASNLIGYPVERGEDPTFLLVAHYDTVNGSPGADDNGSAVAVALEVAARCPHIEIVLPDLEEVGLLGARHFVRNDSRPSIPTVVLESVGYWTNEPGTQSFPPVLPMGFPYVYQRLKEREFRGDFLALLHLQADQALAERMEKALCGTSIRLGISAAILESAAAPALYDFGRSDHLAFWEAGRPCLMLTDSANFRNPNYHQPSDTIDTLGFASMARLVGHLGAFFDG